MAKPILSQEEKRKRVHHRGIHAKDLLLIPNMLTIMRLLFTIPAIWLIIRSTGFRTDFTAAILLSIGFFTDILDGFIARTFDMISDLGKILDPVVDKAVVVSTALALTFTDRDPQFPQFLILAIIIRDILILILSARVLKEDKYLYTSSWTGKAATFGIAATIMAFLLAEIVYEPVLGVLPWVAMGLLLLSSIDYLEKYWSVRHKRKIIKREMKENKTK
jgi:CDP-diacylglycerol--glycerol-3-phosphate 3-phosphatidyltransferase